MIPRSGHRRKSQAPLVAALVFLGAAGLGPAAPGAQAASVYPAGASRPSIPARRFEFARQAKSPRPKHPARTRKKKARKPALRGNPARAQIAFQAMQKYYYLQGSGLYIGEPFSYLWPFSQAFA